MRERKREIAEKKWIEVIFHLIVYNGINVKSISIECIKRIDLIIVVFMNAKLDVITTKNADIAAIDDNILTFLLMHREKFLRLLFPIVKCWNESTALKKKLEHQDFQRLKRLLDVTTARDCNRCIVTPFRFYLFENRLCSHRHKQI